MIYVRAAAQFCNLSSIVEWFMANCTFLLVTRSDSAWKVHNSSPQRPMHDNCSSQVLSLHLLCQLGCGTVAIPICAPPCAPITNPALHIEVEGFPRQPWRTLALSAEAPPCRIQMELKQLDVAIGDELVQ